ncbi:hypothetical protein RCL1_002359 [Eukaryota sp. TZLM3-RCL]
MYFNVVKPKAVPFKNTTTTFVRLNPAFGPTNISSNSVTSQGLQSFSKQQPIYLFNHKPLSNHDLVIQSSSVPTTFSKRPHKTSLVSALIPQTSRTVPSTLWTIPEGFKDAITAILKLLCSFLDSPILPSPVAIVSTFLTSFSTDNDGVEIKPGNNLPPKNKPREFFARKLKPTEKSPDCFLTKAVEALIQGNKEQVKNYLASYLSQKGKVRSSDLLNDDTKQVMLKIFQNFSSKSRDALGKLEAIKQSKIVVEGQSPPTLLSLSDFNLLKLSHSLTINGKLISPHLFLLQAPKNFNLQGNISEDESNLNQNEQFNFDLSGYKFDLTSFDFLKDHPEWSCLISSEFFLIEIINTPEVLFPKIKTEFCLKIGPCDTLYLCKNSEVLSEKLSKLISQYFNSNFDFDLSSHLYELLSRDDDDVNNPNVSPDQSKVDDDVITIQRHQSSPITTLSINPPKVLNKKSSKKLLKAEQPLAFPLTWVVTELKTFLFLPWMTPNSDEAKQYTNDAITGNLYPIETKKLEKSKSVTNMFANINIGSSVVKPVSPGTITRKKKKKSVEEEYVEVIRSLEVPEFDDFDLSTVDYMSDLSDVSDDDDDVNCRHVAMTSEDFSTNRAVSYHFGQSLGDFMLTLKSKGFLKNSRIKFDNFVLQARQAVRKGRLKLAFSLFNALLQSRVADSQKARVLIFRSLLANRIQFNSLAASDATTVLDIVSSCIVSFNVATSSDDVTTFDNALSPRNKACLSVEAYLALHHATSEVEWLKKALDIDPNHPRVLYFLAKYNYLLAQKSNNLDQSYLYYVAAKYALYCTSILKSIKKVYGLSRKESTLLISTTELLCRIYQSSNQFLIASKFILSLVSDKNCLNFDTNISVLEPDIRCLLRLSETLIAGHYNSEAHCVLTRLEKSPNIQEIFISTQWEDSSITSLPAIDYVAVLRSKLLLKNKQYKECVDLCSSTFLPIPKLQFLLHLNSSLSHIRISNAETVLNCLTQAEILQPNDPRPSIIQGILNLIFDPKSNSKAFIFLNRSLAYSLKINKSLECTILSYFAHSHEKSITNYDLSIKTNRISSNYYSSFLCGTSLFRLSSENSAKEVQSNSNPSKSLALKAMHLAPWLREPKIALSHAIATSSQHIPAALSHLLPLTTNSPLLQALIYLWVGSPEISAKILEKMELSKMDELTSLLYAQVLHNSGKTDDALSVLRSLRTTAVSSSIRVKSTLLEAMFLRRKVAAKNGVKFSKGTNIPLENLDRISLLRDFLSISAGSDADLASVPHLNDLAYFLHGSTLYAQQIYISARSSFSFVIRRSSQCLPAIFGRLCINLHLSLAQKSFKLAKQFLNRANSDLNQINLISCSFLSHFANAVYHHCHVICKNSHDFSCYELAINSYTNCINLFLNDYKNQYDFAKEFLVSALRRRASIYVNFLHENLALKDCETAISLEERPLSNFFDISLEYDFIESIMIAINLRKFGTSLSPSIKSKFLHSGHKSPWNFRIKFNSLFFSFHFFSVNLHRTISNLNDQPFEIGYNRLNNLESAVSSFKHQTLEDRFELSRLLNSISELKNSAKILLVHCFTSNNVVQNFVGNSNILDCLFSQSNDAFKFSYEFLKKINWPNVLFLSEHPLSNIGLTDFLINHSSRYFELLSYDIEQWDALFEYYNHKSISDFYFFIYYSVLFLFEKKLINSTSFYSICPKLSYLFSTWITRPYAEHCRLTLVSFLIGIALKNKDFDYADQVFNSFSNLIDFSYGFNLLKSAMNRLLRKNLG